MQRSTVNMKAIGGGAMYCIQLLCGLFNGGVQVEFIAEKEIFPALLG